MAYFFAHQRHGKIFYDFNFQIWEFTSKDFDLYFRNLIISNEKKKKINSCLKIFMFFRNLEFVCLCQITVWPNYWQAFLEYDKKSGHPFNGRHNVSSVDGWKWSIDICRPIMINSMSHFPIFSKKFFRTMRMMFTFSQE